MSKVGQYSSFMPRGWIVNRWCAPRPIALALATVHCACLVTLDDVSHFPKHCTLVSPQRIKSHLPRSPHPHYNTSDTPNTRATLPNHLLFFNRNCLFDTHFDTPERSTTCLQERRSTVSRLAEDSENSVARERVLVKPKRSLMPLLRIDKMIV